AVPQSLRARLEFQLFDKDGHQRTRNHHELYFISKSTAAAPTAQTCVSGMPWLARKLRQQGYRVVDSLDECALVVTAVLTDQLLRYIQTSGNVLWLSDSNPAPQKDFGDNKNPNRAEPP